MHRVYGFDLLRALAILLVFFGHADVWINDLARTPVHWFSDRLDVVNDPFGLWGVELFFALSGVLIGRILLRLFTASGPVHFKHVLRFWLRRWLRIMPAYWIVLFLVWCVSPMIGQEAPGWTFVPLVQNLTVPHPPAFGEAWSLSVEEWSYVLLPVALLIGACAFRSRRNVFPAIVMLIAIIGFALRVTHASECVCRPDQDIRKIVLYRMDALAAGLLMAYLLERWPEHARRWRFHLLAIGVLMWVADMIVGYLPGGLLHGADHFNRSGSASAMALDLTWLDVAFALMMPWAAGAVARSRFLVGPVTWVSAVSYPLYLVHRSLVALPLFHLNAMHWHLPEGWLALLCLVVPFIVAYAIHRLVELPIMRWRDRVLPQ